MPNTFAEGKDDFEVHPCVSISVEPRREDFNWQTPSITIKYVHNFQDGRCTRCDWIKP